MQQLKREFFERDVLKVAPEILGKKIVRKRRGKENKNNRVKEYTITEVEAYDGKKDKACHASKGKTERNKVMFKKGGVWYVYLIYGIHWMLNIVTGKEGYPSAILIRSIKEIEGPGRLTRELQIDDEFDGKPISKETGLYIKKGKKIDKKEIKRGPRIGIEYADEWAEKPYRFWTK